MDLGISGKRALIIGSTQGLGFACAKALHDEGVDVVLNGRTAEKAEAAANSLRNSGREGSVQTIPADLSTEAGAKAVIEALPAVDILVLNNRGPLPGALDGIAAEDVDEALRLHFWGPFHLLKAYVQGMREQRFGRIVAITSAMVQQPHSTMLGSAAARTALTSMLKGIQSESVADNVTVNTILPERIDTPRQHDMAMRDMKSFGLTYEQARAKQVHSIAANRLGRADEVGHTCAFLCSTQASFISGNAIRLDGGSNPYLF